MEVLRNWGELSWAGIQAESASHDSADALAAAAASIPRTTAASSHVCISLRCRVRF